MTRASFDAFFEVFSSEVPNFLLEETNVEDLKEAAKDLHSMIVNFKADKVSIDIKNHKQDNAETFAEVKIVTKDTPFLIDSVSAFLNNASLNIINVLHPVCAVERATSGEVNGVFGHNHGGEQISVMCFFTSEIAEGKIEEIKSQIVTLIKKIAVCVADWKLTESRWLEVGHTVAENLRKLDKTTLDKFTKNNNMFDLSSADSIADGVTSFINWIASSSTIILGLQKFDVKDGKYSPASESYGLFRSEEGKKYLEEATEMLKLSIKYGKENALSDLIKSTIVSDIHKTSHIESIRLQDIDKSGKVTAEYLLFFLFSNKAEHDPSSAIPFITSKIAAVINKVDFGKNSHSYKELVAVLDFFPISELLKSTVEELARSAFEIVSVSGLDKARLFKKYGNLYRFLSFTVFVPKDRFNSDIRKGICDLISEKYNGEVVEYYSQISKSYLARIQILVANPKGKEGTIDEDGAIANEVETEINKLILTWPERLKRELILRSGGETGLDLSQRYRHAFSAAYQESQKVRTAAWDIQKIEGLIPLERSGVEAYQSESEIGSEYYNLKIYSRGGKIPLYKILPVLENFDLQVLEENVYPIEPKGVYQKFWLQHFRVIVPHRDALVSEDKINNFEKAVYEIVFGPEENDSFNKLILACSIDTKKVNLFRAFAKYLHQIRFTHSTKAIQIALSRNPLVTTSLYKLFEAKFSPKASVSEDDLNEIQSQIECDIADVNSSDDNVILSKILELIIATVRTNFYLQKEYISLKIKGNKIKHIPKPVLFAEIFVYGKDFEGIHLRSGKVARGGIRWSDRYEDYRTEVLGLVKAQITKNAVIVPVGSKGGFVVKKNLSNVDPAQKMPAVIECYKSFLRGLLDITDNIVSNEVTTPQNVVIRDEKDPYLVVAADKGTATFSDFANSISAEYGFWLGDAFASGGSNGYDHKKMGITAKGAWISVENHFNSLGKSTYKDEITVVGIGDLSGDVFGNGMLLSRKIKLFAAFNHIHIFLDPTPDCEVSFKERERMFNLPRSTWKDYDATKISKGGGIFERNAKSIPLSNEIKQALGIVSEEKECTPTQLMTWILKANVDLIWNGGIGVFAKSTTETNEDAGDKFNDAIRINGKDLRCKIIGEGGNLGFTQRGRIEAAENGVLLNTDFIDNSAGVDCSDHEVNIKILLNHLVRSKIITNDERNQILLDMTSEVEDQVLRDNTMQNHILNVAMHSSSKDNSKFTYQADLLEYLSSTGALDRENEFLPSAEEVLLMRRQGDKFVRPELCTILSYTKIVLFSEIVNTKLIEDEYFTDTLLHYFPKKLEKFSNDVKKHFLHNEIIATVLANDFVNYTDLHMWHKISSSFDISIPDVVASFVVARAVFGLDEIWKSKNLSDIERVNNFLELFTPYLVRRFGKLNNIAHIIAEIKKAASEEVLKSAITMLGISKKEEIFDKMVVILEISSIASKNKLQFDDLFSKYLKILQNSAIEELKIIAKTIPVNSAYDNMVVNDCIANIDHFSFALSQNLATGSISKADYANIVAEVGKIIKSCIIEGLSISSLIVITKKLNEKLKTF